MKFKNNVSFNRTTKTSKYHLDVRQLSDQCFSSLLTKNQSSFFRKCSRVSLKKSYFEFKVEIQKMTEFIVCICMSWLRKKMNEFEKKILRGDSFSDG
jgi:hypothetical protein